MHSLCIVQYSLLTCTYSAMGSTVLLQRIRSKVVTSEAMNKFVEPDWSDCGTALPYTGFHCPVLYSIAHHSTSVHYISVHCTSLHCTEYHCSTALLQFVRGAWPNMTDDGLSLGSTAVWLGTVQCTLYTVHCAVYTVHCTLYTLYCSRLYTVHCTLYSVRCTLSKCSVYSVQCHSCPDR